MEARPPAQPDTIPVHPHPEGVSPLQWTPLLGAGSRVLGRCTGWQDVTILEKISQPPARACRAQSQAGTHLCECGV